MSESPWTNIIINYFIHTRIIKGIETEPPFFLWNSAGRYPA